MAESMPSFVLQLRPVSENAWSYLVRNHVGAVVAERRCLPDRLTAERVGEAEIRRLLKPKGGLRAAS